MVAFLGEQSCSNSCFGSLRRQPSKGSIALLLIDLRQSFGPLVTVAKYFIFCCKTTKANVLVASGFSSRSFYSRKKNTWSQYEKLKIQEPGTTFSNFSDEIRLEGGPEKCCRFGKLTGVHQGAHICPGSMERFGGRARRGDKRKALGKKRRQTCFQWLRCLDVFLCVLRALQHR